MKLEYEIVKRNDGMYALCEYRWGDHSLNTRTLFVSDKRKDCKEYLAQIKK